MKKLITKILIVALLLTMLPYNNLNIDAQAKKPIGTVREWPGRPPGQKNPEYDFRSCDLNFRYLTTKNNLLVSDLIDNMVGVMRGQVVAYNIFFGWIPAPKRFAKTAMLKLLRKYGVVAKNVVSSWSLVDFYKGKLKKKIKGVFYTVKIYKSSNCYKTKYYFYKHENRKGEIKSQRKTTIGFYR